VRDDLHHYGDYQLYSTYSLASAHPPHRSEGGDNGSGVLSEHGDRHGLWNAPDPNTGNNTYVALAPVVSLLCSSGTLAAGEH